MATENDLSFKVAVNSLVEEVVGDTKYGFVLRLPATLQAHLEGLIALSRPANARVVEVLLVIEGETREMTFHEFKKRLLE